MSQDELGTATTEQQQRCSWTRGLVRRVVIPAQEMPNLVKAYDLYRDQGLVIVGVDLQEGKSLIEPFARDFGIDYPIAIDRTGSVGDEYRLLGLPTTYFVDRGGVIRSSYTGPFLQNSNGTNVQGAIDVSELTNRIEEILAQP